MKSKWLIVLCSVLVISLIAACGNQKNESGSSSDNKSGSEKVEQQVKLSALVGSDENTQTIAKALIAAFEEKNPNIKVEIEISPGGTEGDNLTKTRLATGDMTDVFFYNSGSLLRSLNPEQNMLDLTDEPVQAEIEDSFKQVVSYNGKVYGVPNSTAGVGGWFYNKKVYEELGLSVPKTWDELMSNLEKIKNEGNGVAPVISTYKDTWTSQIVLLADYYNVQSQMPNFADDYTANKAKFSTTPAALRGFEKVEDLVGYMNSDYLASTLDVGISMLAEGKGAHYPMLSLIIPTILQNNPEKIDDIGFFAQPGDDASKNGLTAWLPGAVYVYKETEHVEEAKKFVNFVGSAEGMEVIASVSKPTGPFVVKGVEMPEDTPLVVKDMLTYFDNGQNAPALEFLSPIKGPSLENIIVQIGSGQGSAIDGAKAYDADVEKQAQQLGLEGW